MYRVVRFDQEEDSINDFLSLPKRLYEKKDWVQNEQEEKALLLGNHILSQYFSLVKLLVYDDWDNPSARCVLTIYPGDKTLYIGFFECVADKECARVMFDEVEGFAKENGYEKTVGPVDASFWLKYRLKTNMFDRVPYTSEPYNKDYYLELFLSNQYAVSQRYVSNIYTKLPMLRYEKKKYKDRYKEFIGNGYKIISVKRKDFDQVVRQIYQLLMELYSDFPVFKHIDEDDFCQHFQYFKSILDMSFVKVGYYKGEVTGFFIGIPDYTTLLYRKINLITLVRIFSKRIRSKNYVMLYMGVKKEHQGLGKAIVQTVIEKIHSKRATAIGAFIQEGKVTETYVEDSIDSKYRYVLLERSLGGRDE